MLSPIDLISGRCDAFTEKIERIGTTVGRGYIPDWFSGAGSSDNGPKLTRSTNGTRGARAASSASAGASGAVAACVPSNPHQMFVDKRKKKVGLHFNNLPEGVRIGPEGDDDGSV